MKKAEEDVNYDSEDECFGLKNRKKYEKLSKDRIRYIRSIFANRGATVKQMQLEYDISYSVLNRIKRSALKFQDKWKVRNITKIYGNQKKILIKSIKEYVLNAKSRLTVLEVTSSINQKLNTSYQVNLIRMIMKNEANISFKRVKSRPRNIDLKKINSTWNLFAINFSKMILEKSLLTNIDESSINRSVKNAYSWRVIGHPIECQTSALAGSASMIMAILSNGSWMTLVTSETIDSNNLHGF